MSARAAVIAVDVDGTLYDGVTIHPSAIEALTEASAAGYVILIVSGRPWRDLPLIAPDVVALARAAVCEDGAVLVDITGDAGHHRFAEPPPSELIAELERRGARDVVAGEIAVGMPAEFTAIARAVVADRPLAFRLEHNKNSVAVVPLGCDKGNGLQRSLELLGLAGAYVLAIGDASNDLPMFRVADRAVAVANADRAVADAGIALADASFGEGVAEIVRAHLAAQLDRHRSRTDAVPFVTRTS